MKYLTVFEIYLKLILDLRRFALGPVTGGFCDIVLCIDAHTQCVCANLVVGVDVRRSGCLLLLLLIEGLQIGHI